MAIIAVFSGSWCDADEVCRQAATQLGCIHFSDDDLIDRASHASKISPEKLRKAMYGTPSFLNQVTHEREHLHAVLLQAVALMLPDDSAIFSGFGSMLIPQNIPHIMRVYLNAHRDTRLKNIIRQQGVSVREAEKILRSDDHASVRWMQESRGKLPWDDDLYDIMLPMHEMAIDAAVNILLENSKKMAVQKTPEAERGMQDFRRAAEINAALHAAGHLVDVTVDGETVTVRVNKYVLMFDAYKQELTELLREFPGIGQIDITFGRLVRLPSIAPSIEVEGPSKILLVDDEVEFVHTLSERLKSRSFEGTVVYDGEEALSVVEEDEPDVMVLDLKMPGIDGIEVLRRVKESHPNVEVIILTGHGSVKERELAEELGAFAYLEKPVKIDLLTRTMQEAYSKASQRK